MTQTHEGWEGVFETPFQSGIVTFMITSQEIERSSKTIFIPTIAN